jgi:membrane fusion protein (multidrug efflux system)
MRQKFFFTLGGFLLVVFVLGAVKLSQVKEALAVSHEMPPSAVTTVEAKTAIWKPVINAIGTLAPVEGVTVAADADGTVVKVAAENGALVKAGDLIISLDTSVEAAQLSAAEAQAELAKLQYDRATDLGTKKTISQAELDVAKAQLNQARANVTALTATIDRKNVRAPFDGRIGIRLVNLGQFVARGAPLVPLQKLDPIYVNFTIPQRQLSALSIGQKISVSVDAFPAPFQGTIAAINSEVDAATRSVAVQAKLPNPQEQLRAGMFVQVEVELPSGEPRVVLPATAISYASYGNSVFIVEKMKDKDGKEYLGVRQQPVKVGGTRGDLVAVEGVKPGDQVVSAGVFKLRSLAPVEVNNVVQPTANPNAKPTNS